MTIKNARRELEKPDTPLPVWITGMLAKGSTMILGGEAKLGKTVILTEFADALTTGRPVFGDARFSVPHPLTVLAVDQELGDWGYAERLRKRFTRQGKAPSPNFWYACMVPDIFLDGLGCKKLGGLVQETGADVVLLDPASYFITEGTNTKIRDLFANLRAMRQEVGKPELAVILSHHSGKPLRGSEAALDDRLDPYKFRDGSNWVNDSDSMLTLGYRSDTPYDPVTQWTLKARLTLRHFEQPPDFKLAVNRDWTVTVTNGGRGPNRILTGLGR